MSFKSLSLIAQNKNIPIKFGVSLDDNHLSNSNVVKIARYVFDSITCENAMKPNYLRNSATVTNYTTPASYSFTNADTVITYAKNNSMKMLGHTLWYDPYNTAQFVKDLSNNGTLNTTIMNGILLNHVRNIMSHFQNLAPNTIYSWQVSNESLDSSGNTNTNSVAYRYNNNYVETLYNDAQSYLTTNNLPNIKLFYNDYKDVTGQLTKLKDLKSKNILDGVGLQCHGVSLSDLTMIETNTKLLVDNGFEVHYTEIDFPSPNANDNGDQKNYFVGLLNLALKYGVKNMTFWGIKDDNSWLYSGSGRTPWPGGTKRYPTLFTPSFQPKNCYNALISVLENYGLPPARSPPPNTYQDYDIFIILGQSNSVGRGTSGTNNLGAIANDDYNNIENSNIKQWKGGAIVPAKEGLEHTEGQANNVYGFGTSFARQYVREDKLTPGSKVLLIGCGWGGTGFSDCAGGRNNTWNESLARSSGCGNLVEKAKTRISNALRFVGPNSIIKGILWHQGESDTRNINYRSQAPTMLNGFRTYIIDEINKINTTNQIDTNVKILMGGLMPNYNAPITNMTNTIRSITQNNTNYHFVPSSSIPAVSQFNHNLTSDTRTGRIHFSKQSQIEFGKRYFYIYNGSINFS